MNSADEIRSKIVELYQVKRPVIEQFYAYSQLAAALSEEFHIRRIAEQYPDSQHEELTLACSLDSRETPATLDKKLAELSEVTIKRVIHDRVNHLYHLFV